MKSKPLAFCAMMAALSVTVMLTGGLVPVFTYCSPLIASLLLIPVLLAYGTGKAWAVWFVSSVLALLIGADKEAAFFYCFLGWYPILKPALDRIGSRIFRLAAKAAVFSGSVFAMYYLICFVLQIDEVLSSFSAVRWINIAFLVALVLIMLLYDSVLLRIAYAYQTRLLPRLEKSSSLFRK